MDYFATKSPKSPTAGESDTRSPLRFNDLIVCKDPTPIEHFWLMQMLGNFGAN